MKYTPPTPEDLQRLKDTLGLSSVQMAELFGLSSGRHWRSYTGGADIRSVSASTMFFAMAQLELDCQTIERVLNRMREAGAMIELDKP
ncbi:XRE family transcriptional regulator [Paraburkholderia atlantica]|uniref:XRE family transcriptional regulator n=1 Tax=Paraburkholderia atlantica TaxID=2654982 RepID=UPI003D1DC4D2